MRELKPDVERSVLWEEFKRVRAQRDRLRAACEAVAGCGFCPKCGCDECDTEGCDGCAVVAQVRAALRAAPEEA